MSHYNIPALSATLAREIVKHLKSRVDGGAARPLHYERLFDIIELGNGKMLADAIEEIKGSYNSEKKVTSLNLTFARCIECPDFGSCAQINACLRKQWLG